MEVLAAGAVLRGKYRIVRLLGEGGMALVFEAVHLRLGHKVALKVLKDWLSTNEEIVSRFEREGRALSKLKTVNAVRVFDVDALPNGAPFLVMEYLEGGDLEMELRRRGALPIGEAVGYALQAAAAMQEAHGLGIVHRDLKPTNLFLANEGANRVLKVLDFGVAADAASEGDDVRLTSTATVLGTPLYMAPEQFRKARDVDGRADVWALGATLYEILSGVPPFTGSAATIGVSIVNDEVRPIEQLRGDVPPALRLAVHRALEKDRARRFQSMQELADALRPFSDGVVIARRSSAASFAGGDPVASARTLAATPAVPAQEPRTEASERAGTGAAVTQDSPGTKFASGRGVRWGLVGLAILAGTVALFVTHKSEAPAAAPAPPLSVPASPVTATTMIPTTASGAAAVPSVVAIGSDASPPPARRANGHGSSATPAPIQRSPPATPPSPPPSASSHPLFFPR